MPTRIFADSNQARSFGLVAFGVGRGGERTAAGGDSRGQDSEDSDDEEDRPNGDTGFAANVWIPWARLSSYPSVIGFCWIPSYWMYRT